MEIRLDSDDIVCRKMFTSEMTAESVNSPLIDENECSAYSSESLGSMIDCLCHNIKMILVAIS